MALHRDIFWVGRQWTVTGYGIQAVDQKLKGQFDIAASRLWEDGLAESLHGEPWLNREDFAKALAAARARYPQPRNAVPAALPTSPASPAPLETTATGVAESAPVDPPKPFARYAMRVESWPAKFVRPWRVRVRR